MALSNSEMGSGITLDSIVYPIKGKSFNPDLPTFSTASIIGGLANGSTISLTGFQFGHEVIVALGEWNNNGGHFILFRKGTTRLFLSSYSNTLKVVAYIGIDFDEIIANGTDYYIDFGSFTYTSDEGYYGNPGDGNYTIRQYLSPIFYSNVSVGDTLEIVFFDSISGVITYRTSGTYTITGITQTGDNDYYTFSTNMPNYPSGGYTLCIMYKGRVIESTLNYKITNLPTIVGPVTSGMIWVEGTRIAFIDATKTTTGYKHFIKNDGISYSTGKTPGMMWIDTTNHGKICYIDSTGIERKTYTGDINGSPGNNEQAISGKTPGMIRVSDIAGNYGYLSFIGYDGNRYRIMNGDV